MMKRVITLISVLLLSVFTAICDNAPRMFGMFEKLDGFEYSFLKPDNAESKSEKYLENVPEDNIKLVEMLSTESHGCVNEVKEAVSHAVEINDMKLISRQNVQNKSSEFYAVWDSRRNIFTSLLLLKYSGQDLCHLKLMYIVGELTLKDIENLF